MKSSIISGRKFRRQTHKKEWRLYTTVDQNFSKKVIFWKNFVGFTGVAVGQWTPLRTFYPCRPQHAHQAASTAPQYTHAAKSTCSNFICFDVARQHYSSPTANNTRNLWNDRVQGETDSGKSLAVASRRSSVTCTCNPNLLITIKNNKH